MDDKDWIILKTIHEEKNLTRAAEKLYISQPALTYRISRLEKQLNIKVYLRGKGTLQFTSEGELVVEYARKMLADLSILHDKLSLNKAGTSEINLFAFGTFAHNELPLLLSSYQKLQPNVNFSVTSDDPIGALERLAKAESHIAIMRGNFEWHDAKMLLRKDRMYLVSKEQISLAELPHLSRVIYKMGNVAEKRNHQWWEENFMLPANITMITDKYETCIELVKQGVGYALLPLDCAQQAALQNTLYLLPLTYKDGSPLLVDLWAFYRKETAQLATIKAFLKFLSHHYSDTRAAHGNEPMPH